MRTRRPKKKKLRGFRQSFLSLIVTLILFAFYWAGEQLTTATLPSSNDPPYLYSNQCHDDLQLTLTSAIQEAKQSILLIIYTLTDSKIINSLNEKSEQGIDTRVIYDGKASPFADRRLGPKVKVLKRFGDGLMHLKILVIDGVQTWIGSANMTGDSLKMHGNLIMAMQSSALGEAIKSKADAIPEAGRGLSCPHSNFLIGGHAVELWFLPDDPQALARLKTLISTAKKTIRVAMFTWTRMDLAEAVVEAANRGIKVEVVLDHYSANGASSKIAKFLKKSGIPTYFNQNNGLLHHKFLYVDNQTLVNGSANWTKAAFTKNDDCFVVLNNLSDKQQSQLDSLWDILLKESIPQ
jgi:cardiolipin synthase A/B